MTSKFNNVYINDGYTIGGIYEADGPIKDYFDMTRIFIMDVVLLRGQKRSLLVIVLLNLLVGQR